MEGLRAWDEGPAAKHVALCSGPHHGHGPEHWWPQPEPPTPAAGTCGHRGTVPPRAHASACARRARPCHVPGGDPREDYAPPHYPVMSMSYVAAASTGTTRGPPAPRLQPRVASGAGVWPPAGRAVPARLAHWASHYLLTTNPQKQNPGVRNVGAGGLSSPHSWEESGLAAVEPGPSAEPPWIPGPHGGSAPAPHPGRTAACGDFCSRAWVTRHRTGLAPVGVQGRLPCVGGTQEALTCGALGAPWGVVTGLCPPRSGHQPPRQRLAADPRVASGRPLFHGASVSQAGPS